MNLVQFINLSANARFTSDEPILLRVAIGLSVVAFNTNLLDMGRPTNAGPDGIYTRCMGEQGWPQIPSYDPAFQPSTDGLSHSPASGFYNDGSKSDSPYRA